jgi:peptide chain release factor 1
MINQSNPGESDEDLKEMAMDEVKELESKVGELEGELIKNLVPKDMADEGSAILEIRAGMLRYIYYNIIF